MTGDPDVDVDELRTELDQIKQAMGLTERYSGATSLWLLFGLAVPLAAALSQYVVLERLPHWFHSIIWLGVLGGAILLYAYWSDQSFRRTGPKEGKPRIWIQFLLVYLAALPLQAIASAYVSDLSYVADATLSLSIIIVVVGIGYGILGSSLRAYYVRNRDRYVFYVGTVWMIALAVLITRFDSLAEWSYALFGATYFVYAIGAYLFLERGGELRA